MSDEEGQGFVDPFWMKPYVPHVPQPHTKPPARVRKPRPKKPRNPEPEPDTLEKIDRDYWHYWRQWYAEQRARERHDDA